MSKLSKAIKKNKSKLISNIPLNLGPLGVAQIAGGSVADDRRNSTGPGQAVQDSSGYAGIDRYQQYAGQDWGVWGDDYNRTNQLAYNAFQEILGRAPTQQEFSEAMPYFHNQGDQGQWTGRQYLNNIAKFERESPEAKAKNAPQFHGQVGGAIQKLMQRGATPAELDHFGKLLATGQIDEYELNGFLQQMPEYRNAQDTQFRGQVNTELQNYDRDFFNKGKEDILSQYAKSGLQNSSALDFALTNMMGEIAKERNKFLTGLSVDQYRGNKDAAREDYRGTMDRYMDDRAYSRDRRDYMYDDLLKRSREIQDYDFQSRDYARQMGRGGGRMDPFTGAVGGAAAGAAGGPWGAVTGAGLGGLYGYLNR